MPSVHQHTNTYTHPIGTTSKIQLSVVAVESSSTERWIAECIKTVGEEEEVKGGWLSRKGGMWRCVGSGRVVYAGAVVALLTRWPQALAFLPPAPSHIPTHTNTLAAG